MCTSAHHFFGLPAGRRLSSIAILFAVLVAGLGVTTGASAIQPGEGTPPPSEADRDRIQRERARRMVEVRLERIRAEEARLEATIAAIDAGQPLSELRLPEPEPRERPRPDHDEDHDRRDQEPQFTDEQIRAFIAEVYPEWVDRMKELEARDPQAVERMLDERRPRLVELMIERRDHPQVFAARQSIARSEMRIRRAAWSYARADDGPERQEAERALSELLEEQFELRLGLYRAELAEAEAEVDAIRARLTEAIEKRVELIAERKADLLQAIRDRRPPQGPRDRRPGRDGDGPPRR